MDTSVWVALVGLLSGGFAAVLGWQVNSRRAATDDRSARGVSTLSAETAAVSNAALAVTAQQSVVGSLLAENGRLRMQLDSNTAAIVELQAHVARLQTELDMALRENSQLRARVAGLEAAAQTGYP